MAKMNKENVLCIYNKTLLGHAEEYNPVIGSKMVGIREHHVKWNKPDIEGHVWHIFFVIGRR